MKTSAEDNDTISMPSSLAVPAARKQMRPGLDPATTLIRCCEIGTQLLEKGRYAAALAQFETALNLDAHAVEGWYGRSVALACTNRYQAALDSIDQAQTLVGLSEIRIWIQKATVLMLLERPEAALGCCDYVLWLQPQHAQAWLFRSVALHRLGKFRQAYQSYNRAAQWPSQRSSAAISA